MKSGRGYNEREYFNITHITLVGLENILKRVSLQDMFLYTAHQNLEISSDLFASSICFNLFSEWGVGNRLKPLIVKAFHNPEELSSLNNPFYNEVVRCSQEIVSVIRSEESLYEYSYKYTTEALTRKDDISFERFIRLFPLINTEDSGVSTESPGEDEDTSEDSLPYLEDSECNCNFCIEFSKYCYPKQQTVEEIIFEVVKKISLETPESI